ncbi:MAG: ABC transporter permease subunit [Microcoleus sp. PH2017_10_PVI_O_A]|uniref:amino acid ABC transporter permease n=1 Tax=unclassified Microcoleus TaxID=2642155 RepID=UPI001D8EC0CB|nr:MULTISPECIES: ABC transporter permease subunit [unclassified Microcoleus]TAE74739.1 MAG: ABC transporter permease subunit [Oscillatoriales cyanobacterium]MCC3409651.1 ABC transporter permease subunit [Microcoleus sp. PH2017_10_PVI_O_A]MCC3463906.1 ABC transporter permease subunit [Microcoleus sp. PH2017_11_PCY_U_A]MCC3482252.1 ABC transporter permease subunit [Microcoleus sp. PH2017_12_PCY_D_A]MCC3531969.1 ABC transporter permease subunit [Microcoleus sp. PH2017_21_RUC_O_A]
MNPEPQPGKSQKSSKIKDISTLLRDDRFWKIAGQAIALILVITVIAILWDNLTANYAQLGIAFGFDFLNSQASFDIGESVIPYSPENSYIQAYFVGLINTLRVMGLGIVFSTIAGLTVGIARLSDNWLLRNLAALYVEILRNTPLLLQLFFWYFAVFISLPKLEDNQQMRGPIYLTNRGIAVPWPAPLPGFEIWLILLTVGVLAAAGLWMWRGRVMLEEAKPGRQLFWAGGAIVLSAILAFIITQNLPFRLDFPRLTPALQLEGGLKLTPEFAALVTGLSLYTGSYIAEIVRAGIQSVSRGQWEAGKSLGLKSGTLMRMVILPQALRVIVPPLTSQYLNLAKNSSLAVAVAYPDVYFVVGSPTLNQTGRAIETMLIIMVTYLTISLIVSLFMNWYNHTVQIKER